MLRILVLLVFFATTHAWGQIVAPDVTVAQLEAAENSVSASLAADDPQRASLLKSYADTRAALTSFEQFNAQLKSFSQARSNAQQDAVAIENKLAIQQNAPEQDYKVAPSVALSELEQQIQIDEVELDAQKSQVTDIRAAIDAMPQRPTEIRARLTELTSTLAALEESIGIMNKKATSGGSDEAALWLARAQIASGKAEKAALEEEMASQPMRLELLKAQLDQLSYEIAEKEKKSRAMAQRVGELRQGEAARAQAAANLILLEAQGKHELIQELAARNAELTRTFGTRSEDIEKATHQSDVTKAKAEQLEADLKAIERKLELLGMSRAVGAILRERQAQLPDNRELLGKISANEDDIRASSLRQVELEDERGLMRSRSAYVKQLLESVDPQVAELVRDDMMELVRDRRDLLRKAVDLENIHVQKLGDLDFTLRRYAMAVDAYREFISERLLWIPSRDKFGVFQGEEADMLKQFREVFAPSRWWTVIKNLPAEFLARPISGVFLLLVLILVYSGPRLKQRLTDTGKFVGYVRSDTYASTLQALGLSLLLSLKWPLLLLTTAWLFELHDKEAELATAISIPAARTSLYFWGLEFLRISLWPKGLVAMHFRWPAKLVSQIAKRIVTLELTLLPIAFLVGFFLQLYPREVGGSLGTIAVVLALCAIGYFFHRLPEFVQVKMQMLLQDTTNTESPLWSTLVRKLLTWIPLAGILAVLFGYTYTAMEIAFLLTRTFVLLACILILHELGLRWLRMARRLMTFKTEQEKAKADDTESEISDGEVVLESDTELLSYEGTRLLNLLTLLGGILGAILIWADIFPAFSIFDNVKLWHQTAIVDGREIADPVTLTDLMKALLIAIVGWIVLSRIPNLLEIFLRQKAKMHAASAYAFTRVFQYVTTTLLVVIVVSSLGVSWSSMQWAVAALSVGIGFGLQEIVANFISGLIVLVEQPIRVGDIVTVGEVSGKVTRIQMRATTIRDFDNRELLVPNKEFITKQLLNWSLTDSVTRRLVQVGVAYGTDIDQALALVADVAEKHPLVLADPEPLITFDEFGESSLLISLRYLIEHLDQRLIVDSELRVEINRRFNEAGIVIAFPQRDIHIGTKQPLEIRMVESGPAV